MRREEARAALRAIESNGTGDRAGSQSPADALDAARVDLIELLREGIPERQYVPGGEPWLIVGKRYLIPAPAGAGKSLMALVVAVGVAEARGTVAILDVENGADEYARRLRDVLAARDDADGTLAIACVERLRYYAWPALRVTWGEAEWTAALAGADLVIFDSSRLVLSAAGLDEDSNDDYAQFVNALLIPLARAGVTTIVLDNTGHEDRNRARGASAKGDLNEVVYVAKPGEDFDSDRAGHLRLVRQRTRFADLPGEMRVRLGGGTYGPALPAEPSNDSDGFRPTGLMERASKTVEENPGRTRNNVLARIGGKKEYAAMALALLVTEKYVRIEPGVRGAHHHYSERPYRQATDPHRDPGSRLGPDQDPDPEEPLGPGTPHPEGVPVPVPSPRSQPTGTQHEAPR